MSVERMRAFGDSVTNDNTFIYLGSKAQEIFMKMDLGSLTLLVRELESAYLSANTENSSEDTVASEYRNIITEAGYPEVSGVCDMSLIHPADGIRHLVNEIFLFRIGGIPIPTLVGVTNSFPLRKTRFIQAIKLTGAPRSSESYKEDITESLGSSSTKPSADSSRVESTISNIGDTRPIDITRIISLYEEALNEKASSIKQFVAIGFSELPRLNTSIRIEEAERKSYYAAYRESADVYFVFPTVNKRLHGNRHNLFSGIFDFNSSRYRLTEDSVFHVNQPCIFIKGSGAYYIATQKGKILVDNK